MMNSVLAVHKDTFNCWAYLLLLVTVRVTIPSLDREYWGRPGKAFLLPQSFSNKPTQHLIICQYGIYYSEILQQNSCKKLFLRGYFSLKTDKTRENVFLLRFWTLQHRYEIRRKTQLAFNVVFPCKLFICINWCCVTLFLCKSENRR